MSASSAAIARAACGIALVLGGGGGTLYASANPAAIWSGLTAAILTPWLIIVPLGHTLVQAGSPSQRSQISGALVVGWKVTAAPGHLSAHRTQSPFLAVRKHLVVSTLIVLSFLLLSTDNAFTGHASMHFASSPH